jgi:hypothetical protein
MLQKLLKKGDKKLVFHLGVNAGFFSEYNNMLLAILYCLRNYIKFVLYSKDANFSYNVGWEDYFVPFSSTTKQIFHSKYNFRSQNEYQYFRSNKLDRKIVAYKWITGTDFLTFELFEKFREEANKTEEINIPGWIQNIHIVDGLFEIDKQIFKYNESTYIAINELISKLNIQEEYVGFHIRSGDKSKETLVYSVRDYIKKASENSPIRTAFVSTDDFQIILKLKTEFPEWKLYYLCPENRIGYFQKEFDKISKGSKKNEMIELFASIELLTQASCFVGTYSSNIGMYIGIRKMNKNCFGVDFDSWRIW